MIGTWLGSQLPNLTQLELSELRLALILPKAFFYFVQNLSKFLIDKTDIPPSQIQVIGYAENRPIETNETPAGRSVNRRVEIIISKEHISDNLTPAKNEGYKVSKLVNNLTGNHL